MTNKEIIDKLGQARAALEWEHPLDLAAAIDEAIKIVEQAEKYRWHDLRKNPDDLPEWEVLNAYHCYSRPVEIVTGGNIYDTAMLVRNVRNGNCNTGYDYWWFGDYPDGEEPRGWVDLSDMGITGRDIIAWREIESYSRKERNNEN